MRLSGKVAMVTGGGAGIGLACVELFAQEGARVVIAEFDENAGRATLERIAARGGTGLFVATDVSKEDSVRNAVDQTMSRFGRIDILYNNVGGSTPQDGPVTTAPVEEFWRKMNVDVFGTWLGCRQVIPHMTASGGGSIINATSMCGLIGTENKDSYTAAKGAIVSMTRSMAVEYGRFNIRVNAVAPAVTLTDRVRGRMEGGRARYQERHVLGLVEPQDVAYAVLFLASDESRRTTGHVLTVDSGVTIS
jgi:NAD(P)-dependent dehydrogenase (short-subunit alcohol dehydrogenase family)